MAATAAQVKELREMTGAGIMDCKEALGKSDGDVQKAKDYLRQKGMAKADKKSSRTTGEGRIGFYLHHNGKLGVMVEVLCETDFVAKNDKFQELMKEVAMQIASNSPEYVSREEVPADYIAKEHAGYLEAAIAEGKKPEIAEKIATGKVDKYLEGICLMEQVYFRDETLKIKDYVKQCIGVVGENIVIRRFNRMQVGE